MGHKTADLDRKNETIRHRIPPGLKCLFPGKAIKRVIDLNGLEVFGIIGEPALLTKIGRIKEPPAPMAVVPAAGPDEKRSLDLDHDESLGEEFMTVKSSGSEQSDFLVIN